MGGIDDTTDTGLTHLGAREYDPETGRILSVDPRQSRQHFLNGLAAINPAKWGGYRSHPTASGLEVEMGIGSATWAKTDPVDPGTRRVVTGGARLLHDPTGILADLLAACS
uniref:Uncharacterized protein n=1 Tax=Streptomyces auratus AGR0001 TaxID=1160718 RepID=J1RVU5_9ACTN